MSSASSRRPAPDAEPEIARLADDPADDDANAAPTKVGPMSKAFVDQLMFKAQLAESSKPAPLPLTDPPASGQRSRAARADSPEAPAVAESRPVDVPALSADEGLAFEPTVLGDAARPPPASIQPSAASAASARATPARSAPPSSPRQEPAAAPSPVAALPALAAPLPALAAPAASGNEPAPARWPFGVPLPGDVSVPRDRRLVLEVAGVLAAIVITVAAVVIFLFP